MSLPKGVLNLHLIEAKGLKTSGLFGRHERCDAYATLALEVDKQRQSYRTEVEDNKSHPIWNMLLDLPVDDPDSIHDARIEARGPCPAYTSGSKL